MQRDMKVGMAVGVALVGIVGALFFRREPEARDKGVPPPRLQDVDEIDRRIVEKPRGPYMNGVEDFPDQSAPVPPPRSAQAKPKSETHDHDAPTLTKRDEKNGEKSNSSASGSAPEPILTPRADSAVSDNIPAHNRAWEPAGPPGNKSDDGRRSTASGTAGTAGRTHVIRPGDTLSGLASHYLGSSARYREIYEANRKVLRSPDELPDGVTIVIPDSGKPRDPQQQTAKAGAGAQSASKSGAKSRATTSRGSDSETDDPPGSDANSSKLRFVPVKRGPYSAGRSQPSGDASKSDDRP